jgi:xanthine dehydrogenase accessory factor
MRAALEMSRRWAREGKEVAAATLVAMGGSTPRRAGARLVASSAGDRWGSVSFGCVEADVATHVRSVLDDGQSGLASYGLSDEDAFAVGFTCGGVMEVFIERWTHLHDLLGGVPDEEFVGSMATVLSGTGIGAHGLFDATGRFRAGDMPEASIEAARPEAIAATSDERARVVEAGETRVFVEPVVPSPRLIVFGAGHTAEALTAAAAAVGFRVTVSDHRPEVAQPERYPAADAVIVGRPERTVPSIAPDSRTYVVCLAHNLEVEETLLPLVLAAETRYVGVLGSRRTHAARVDRLLAAGVTAEQIKRLHAPIGLNVGAVTPEEIAASIVAELIAVRRAPRRSDDPALPGDGQHRGGE